MTTISPNLRLSGLVLFGDLELMVGLSDSRWLRIPLGTFPEIQAMTEDEKLNYRIGVDHSVLQWPQHAVTLSLPDLCSKTTSIDDGDEGPK